MSNGNVKIDPKKVTTIADCPVPTLVKQIQQFMGVANYYNRFIPNFSQIATPIMPLLKKIIHFEWDLDQQVAPQKSDSQLHLFCSCLTLKKFSSKLMPEILLLALCCCKSTMVNSYHQHTIVKSQMMYSVNTWSMTTSCLQSSQLFLCSIATLQGVKPLRSQTTNPLSISRDKRRLINDKCTTKTHLQIIGRTLGITINMQILLWMLSVAVHGQKIYL